MDINVIKSYLVELGFEVDQPGVARFNEALRRSAQQVERVTGGIIGAFAKVGAAVTATLFSISAGTVGLVDKVAEADLGYQLFARRMFMSADAAKQLKIATDALGYSLEDIIWGPPELQQRYEQLIKDQKVMQKNLGPDFETRMRQIRDIRFQFTRLGVELQYLAMQVVKDLSNALFGDQESLLDRLREFNEWLINNLPRVSQEIVTRLVPILKDVGRILKDLWEIAQQINVRKIADDLVWLADKLRQLVDLITKSPTLQKILGGAAAGAAVGSVIPGVGTGVGAVVGGAVGAAHGILGGPLSKAQIKDRIAVMARQMGIDPALAEAVAEQESGFNAAAINRKSGATGLFQLMPGTAAMLGVNPNDPEQNIRGGLTLLRDLLRKYHGNVGRALKDYGGFVTQDPSDYIGSVMRRYQKWKGIEEFGNLSPAPISYNVDVGGIHINQPNATPAEIQKAVSMALEDKMGKQTQRTLAQFSGVYS